jgi:HlyD family secretion protein
MAGSKFWVVLGGFLVTLLACGHSAAQRPTGQAKGRQAPQTNSVEKRVNSTVRESGELIAAARIEFKSPVSSTIEQLVPNGSAVKTGDLLMTIDTAPLQVALLKQKVALNRERASLARAERTAVLIKEQFDLELAAAKLRVVVAEEAETSALEKGGQVDLDVMQADAKINVARKQIELADAALELLPAGNAEDLGLKRKQIQLTRLQATESLGVEEARKKLLAGPIRRQQAAVLKLAVVEARSAILTLQKKHSDQVGDVQVQVAESEANCLAEQQKLAPIESQIAGCRVVAPSDGVVTYAITSSRFGAQRAAKIEVGGMTTKGQPVIQLVDMSKLQVQVEVHETRIKRVKPGQPATIEFDALTGRTLRGRVVRVGSQPLSTSWYQLKVTNYHVWVALESSKDPGFLKQVNLGMNGVVEITTAEP